MIWKDKECLHLVLMKEPFQRILNGDKIIEYRDTTPYWDKRLMDKDIKWIYFQYAYHKNPSYMVVKCLKKERLDRWNLHLGEIFEKRVIHLKKSEVE